MEEKEQRRCGADERTQKDLHRPSLCIDHLSPPPKRALGVAIDHQKADRDHTNQDSDAASCKLTEGTCEHLLREHGDANVSGLILFILRLTRSLGVVRINLWIPKETV